MTTIPISVQIDAEIFLAELNRLRIASQHKADEDARAEAAAEAARISEATDKWGVIFADVKQQLPAWAQPFLVAHTDFQSDAPRSSAALDLVLPFEAGPWPITISIVLSIPDISQTRVWNISGDYRHPEPYAVSSPRSYMDDDGEWQMDYWNNSFRELADAVLYAGDAAARDAELRAENAAKNAVHARMQLQRANLLTPSELARPVVPVVPACTSAERALLDALNAVIYDRGEHEV